jgi:hypothetical protein
MADRALAGKVTVSQGLIHYGDGCGCQIVGIVKQSATKERNAHDAEVSGTDRRIVRERALPLWRLGAAFDLEQISSVPGSGRQLVGLGQRGRLRPWDCLRAIQQLLGKGELLRWLAVVRRREVQGGGHQVARLEAKIGIA